MQVFFDGVYPTVCFDETVYELPRLLILQLLLRYTGHGEERQQLFIGLRCLNVESFLSIPPYVGYVLEVLWAPYILFSQYPFPLFATLQCVCIVQ